MVRLIIVQILMLFFLSPKMASSVTLDELFSNVRKCEFKDFYYAPWDTGRPIHPYFSERKLEPYKESNGVYYFKVNEMLFGLPVSELVVPGTWDFHGVVFDVPLAKSRAVFKKKFGTTFTRSEKSIAGDNPALEDDANKPGKSFLYCNERDGG